jgi:hypothetical protein
MKEILDENIKSRIFEAIHKLVFLQCQKQIFRIFFSQIRCLKISLETDDKSQELFDNDTTLMKTEFLKDFCLMALQQSL